METCIGLFSIPVHDVRGLLPISRLERSRCAADAFACAGRAVEVMI
jgi:hypothetical protein